MMEKDKLLMQLTDGGSYGAGYEDCYGCGPNYIGNGSGYDDFDGEGNGYGDSFGDKECCGTGKGIGDGQGYADCSGDGDTGCFEII